MVLRKKKKAKKSDHSSELGKLKKLKGQIEGVEKMINEQRYCADVIGQVRAVRSGLLSVEASMLETHLKNCVSEAIRQGKQSEVDTKIDEIVQIFRQSASRGVRI